MIWPVFAIEFVFDQGVHEVVGLTKICFICSNCVIDLVLFEQFHILSCYRSTSGIHSNLKGTYLFISFLNEIFYELNNCVL